MPDVDRNKYAKLNQTWPTKRSRFGAFSTPTIHNTQIKETFVSLRAAVRPPYNSVYYGSNYRCPSKYYGVL